MTLRASTKCKGVFVILPVYDMAMQLIQDYNAYREKYPESPFRGDIQIEHAVMLVTAMLDDALNRNLLWVKRGRALSHDLDTALEKLFGHWDSNLNDPHSEALYLSVFDHIDIRLSNLLHPYIPEPTWNVWYTKPLGNDVLLEQGTDYRIADWTRRMESKEWS